MMQYNLERKTVPLQPETSTVLQVEDGAEIRSIRAKNPFVVELLILTPVVEEDEIEGEDE